MSKRTILVVAVNQLVSYSTPLISFPLLLIAFDITAYGIWIEANTLLGLVITFAFTGIANGLNIAVFSTNVESDVVYVNSLYLVSLLGIVFSGIIFVGAPLLNMLTIHQPIGETIYRLLSVSVLTNGLLLLCPQICRLRGKTLLSITFEILVSVARVAAAVVALVTKDLALFATVYVILQTVAIAPLLVMAYYQVQFSSPSWLIIRQLLSHGFNLTVVYQASWLVMYGDRLLLTFLAASASVAIYSATYQLTLILVALGAPYLYVLLPRLGERWKAGDVEGAQQAVRQSTRATSILLIPAVVGLTLVGSALLQLLGGDEFGLGPWLIAMIAFGVTLDVIGTHLQYIFYAQGRPQVLRQIYVQAAALNLGLNLLVIPLLSYYGAGITTLLTFAFILFRLWRQTAMPLSALFDTSVLGRCLLASAMMGVWVAATIRPTVVGLAIAVGGGATIYGAGLLLTRVVSLSELVHLRRAVASRFNVS